MHIMREELRRIRYSDSGGGVGTPGEVEEVGRTAGDGDRNVTYAGDVDKMTAAV